MAWKERSRVDERVQLVSEYLKAERSMSEICQDFGVSRKTGYKWVARYQESGPQGLLDRSRAPRHHPNRVDVTVVEALLMARRAHPNWGSRKVLAWLARKQPELELPAPSTVSALYARYGLSISRGARRRTPPFTDPFVDADEPNRLWCADYKGDFKTGDRSHCYPLTITDAYSRSLLRCYGLASTKTQAAWKVFESAFREYGLPDRIRTDNGTPFASQGAGGLSRLSIWRVKLGIRHERIEPGRPDQNGRHERMHRTLKQETLKPPARTVRLQQRRFEQFRHEYNHERPHEGIGNATPASLYVASTREYSGRLAEVQRRAGFRTRRLPQCGRIRWDGALIAISAALGGELIGLQENEHTHHIYFGDVFLGFIDPQQLHLGLVRPPISAWSRSEYRSGPPTSRRRRRSR